MKLPISVSDQTMFEATTQPIGTLGSFEQTSDSALERNITEQIEYIGNQLLLNVRDPRWKDMRDILVNDVVRAYIARKLIRVPEFKVYWFDSYRIIPTAKGGAIVEWYGADGIVSRKDFQCATGLLHSVGRDYLNQCPGAVVYKRGKYEMHPHMATFKLASH